MALGELSGRYTDPLYIVTITSAKILMPPRVAPIGATPRPFGPRGGCIIRSRRKRDTNKGAKNYLLGFQKINYPNLRWGMFRRPPVGNTEAEEIHDVQEILTLPGYLKSCMSKKRVSGK